MGPYSVKTGQIVYVNDSYLLLAPLDGKGDIDGDGVGKKRRANDVELRIYFDLLSSPDAIFQLQQDVPSEAFIAGYIGMFGADPTASGSDGKPIRFGHGEGILLIGYSSNPFGCEPYKQKFTCEALFVYRGDCTFLEKLIFAQRAGASGVVVLGDEEQHINPSAEKGELDAAGPQLNEVAVVVLRKSDADLVTQMLDAAERLGLGTVKLIVEPSGGLAEQHGENDGERAQKEGQKKVSEEEPIRVLYLNNHPLLNTRLLV